MATNTKSMTGEEIKRRRFQNQVQALLDAAIKQGDISEGLETAKYLGQIKGWGQPGQTQEGKSAPDLSHLLPPVSQP